MSLVEQLGLEFFYLILVVDYLLLGALHILLHILFARCRHVVLLVHLLQLPEQLLLVKLLDSLQFLQPLQNLLLLSFVLRLGVL